MTALHHTEPAVPARPERPLLIAATPVSDVAGGLRTERVVVRVARDDERGEVEALAGLPPQWRAGTRRWQLVTGVVALVGDSVVGAAGAFWADGAGLTATIGVRPAWRDAGVGSFLGRSLARTLRALGAAVQEMAVAEAPEDRQSVDPADGRLAFAWKPARPVTEAT